MEYSDKNGEPGKYIPLDEAEFERIFHSSFVSLCTFCQLKYGFDPDLAKEVVHLSFIKLWQSRQRIDLQQPVKAYLYKIVHNTSFDALKDQQKQRLHRLLSTDAGSERQHDYNTVEVKQLEEAVRYAVSQLPDQMRNVFEMSRYEGLKYTEIAERLNLSLKTVETHMRRALIKLRQLLARHLPGLLLGLIIEATSI
jgi:RNA polymerase sigma-70 factor (ECF subfamily)